MRQIVSSIVVVVMLTCVAVSHAAEWGLKEGTPELKSAGPLVFGPDGVLFVGDTKAATVFAIDTNDKSGQPSKVDLKIADLTQQIADSVGASPQGIRINDLAVNPQSGNVYLSISKSKGQSTTASIVRIDGAGKVGALSLKKIPFAKVELPNPPEDKVTGQGRRQRNNRDSSITDLAYIEGKVIVSGLSNAKSPSTVRELLFPFAESDQGTNLEIYHGAHGKFEDYAAIRTIVPFNIDGEPNLLATFTCTPLVKLPLASLNSGKKVRGTTIAELGNRNRPLDMIVYEKGGEEFLLLSNSARGIMKISTKDIGKQAGITERVSGGGKAGQPYDTIEGLEGVVQLDKLDDKRAIILVQAGTSSVDLRTIALP